MLDGTAFGSSKEHEMAFEDRYSSKAEKYAKYRWDYPPESIRRVLNTASLPERPVVADIGSGTGKLTRHFVETAGTVYAVEPSPGMRRMAERDLARHPSFRSIDAPSHATTLPDRSVDLIAVGQAAHWFDAEPTRDEFLRILRPGGWLTILGYRGTDEKMDAAFGAVRTEDNGCNVFDRSGPPLAFWFGHGAFAEHSFTHTSRQSWEQFLVDIASTSWAPDDDHPLYPRFERAARAFFDHFAADGQLVQNMETRAAIGQPQ
jgi:SAM-dependent methyltransferase